MSAQLTRRSCIAAGIGALLAPRIARAQPRQEIDDSPLTLWASPTGTGDGSRRCPMGLQQAIDFVCDNLVIDNQLVTIQLTPSTAMAPYGPIMLRDWFGSFGDDPSGGGPNMPGPNFTVPTIRGDPKTPGSYVLGGTAAAPADFAILGRPASHPWFISGVTVQCGHPAQGNGIYADINALLYLGRVIHGPSASCVFANWGGRVEFISQCEQIVVGPGYYFANAAYNGAVLSQGQPITIYNHPYFISLTNQETGGQVDLSLAQFRSN